jgi:Mg2+ and Co2+ transporter CorA
MRFLLNNFIALLFTLSIVSILACSDTKLAEIAKLKQEVMAIHDEMMPKMDDLMTMKSKLNQVLSQPDSMLSAADSTMRAQEILEALNALNQADEAMMVWMRNYHAEDITQLDSLVGYLNNEMKSVKEMKLKMIDGIKKAEETLAKYSAQ